MHQEVGRDAQAPYLERLTRVALDELHVRRHVVEAHREIGGIHLVGKRRLQRLGRARRADDGQMSAGNESRREERKALDVVQVCVRDQQVRLQRGVLREVGTQLGNAGPGVDDDQVVVPVADLDAGGVAAVTQGAPAGSGPGAPRAPELDPHRTAVRSNTRLATKTSSRSRSSFPVPASA